TGLVNGDTLAAIATGTAAFGTTATVTSNVGSYAVTGSGLSTISNANYTVTFAQAAGNATALSVTARPLTLTPNQLTRLFGAANPTTGTAT
ncbi:MBG domain-containing protein, partial [Acinetobacter baumannii]